VLRDPRARVQDRILAARVLGNSGAVDAIDALVQAAGSADERLRGAAIEALRKLQADVVLARRIADPKAGSEEKTSAADGLRVLRAPASVAALVGGLRDADPKVRARCAHALSVFGAELAAPALLTALGDRERDVRYYALLAVSSLDDARARAALRARLAVERDEVLHDELERVLGG
jgi:HEAT repeat protein